MVRKLMILLAIALAVPALAAANSIDVTVDAAMGNSSSSACGVAGAGCGLSVFVDDTATTPATLAYVQSDHMTNETAVRFSFYINAESASGFTMPGGLNIRVGRVFDPGNGTKMVWFLKRNFNETSWRFAIYSLREGVGNFQFAGEGFLSNSANDTPIRVDIEWTAATTPNNGIIRAFRTLDQPGATPTLMFENLALENQGAVLNSLQFGLPSTAQFNGTFGEFYLDEVVISRL